MIKTKTTPQPQQPKIGPPKTTSGPSKPLSTDKIILIMEIVLVIVGVISLTALALGVVAFFEKLSISGGVMSGELDMGQQPLINAEFIAVSGVDGAVQASRYAGATSNGPPTKGAFETGDFIVDLSGNIWICSTAGTPGSWKSVGSSAFVQVTGLNSSLSSSRFIGSTNGSSPKSGSYLTGDFAVDLSGDLWICSNGANSTWQSIKNSLGTPSTPLTQLYVTELVGNNVTTQALSVSGVSGATIPSRYVGATSSGAPQSGTFISGDFVIDLSGNIWVYTSSSRWQSLLSSGTYLGLAGGTMTGDILCTGTVNLGSSQQSFSSVYAINVVASQLSGTLTTPSQPNVTQVGTLTQLTMGGFLNMSNSSIINASSVDATLFSCLGSFVTGIVSARFLGATTSGAPTASRSFSPGDFVVDLTGNIWVFNTAQTWVSISPRIAFLPLAGGTVSGSILPATTNSINLGSSGSAFANVYATNLFGTLQNASQPNIQTLAGVTSLNGIAFTTGSIGGFVLSGSMMVSGSSIDIGAVGNGLSNLYATNVMSTALTGTLQTAAQTNITSLGTLTGLSIQGTLDMKTNAINNVSQINSVSFACVGGFNGVTLASRFLGGTLSSYPTTGSYSTGDFVVDYSGNIWVYTSGSTWKGLNAAGSCLLLTGGTMSGSILAATSGTVNIGSVTNPFRSIYANNLYGTLQTQTQSNILTLSSVTSLNGITISPGGIGSFTLTGSMLVSGTVNLGSSTQSLNSVYSTNVISTNLTGQVQTAAQPNINSVGALIGLTINGALSMQTNNISGAYSVNATYFASTGGFGGSSGFTAARFLGGTTGVPPTGTYQTCDFAIDTTGNVWVYDSSSTWQSMSLVGQYLPVSGGSMTGSILPASTGTLNLGSSSLLFNNVYASNIWGTVKQVSQPGITTLAGVTSLAGIAISANTIGAFTLEGSITVASGVTPNIGTSALPVANLYCTTLNATSITGSVYGNQANITSVGALTALTISGNLSMASYNITSAGSITSNSVTSSYFACSGSFTSGLLGARFVGGTTSGAPTTGTFTAGDFVVDQSGNIWVYTTGSTWTGFSPANYLPLAGGTISGSIVPTVNNTINLGSSSTSFSNVYATNLWGTLQTGSQTNITGVGTITTGTWQASAVGVTWGGTGSSTLPSNLLLLGNGTGALTSVSAGAAGTVLVGQGSGSAPIFTASPSVTSITITATPVNSTDGANKAYVDSISAGLIFKQTCYLSTTGALTATYYNGTNNDGIGATLTNSGALAAFLVDGTAASVNSRILVKDQVTSAQNGIYVVTVLGDNVSTTWVLTRATDWNQVSQMQAGDIVPVQTGVLNASTTWLQTANVTTVGTSSINFSQFSYAASTFLKVANNLSEFKSAPSAARGYLGLSNISTQTLTANSILVGGAGNTISGAAVLTSGQLLVGVTSGAPVATTPTNGNNISWTTGAGSLQANLSGIVSVVNGGTGLSTSTAYTLLAGNTSSQLQYIAAGTGTLGNMLVSGGSSATPTWAAPTSGTVTQITAGTGITITTGTTGSLVTTAPLTSTGTISITSPLSGITWNGNAINLTYGGTGAALTASAGGMVYCGTSAMAIVAGTSTGNSILLSGTTTTPAPSWLAPSASCILVCDSKSVPNWSQTLPSFSMSGTITPSTNQTYDIGSSTYMFATGYFESLYLNSATASSLVYADSKNNLSSVTIGNGLSLSTTGTITLSANVSSTNFQYAGAVLNTIQDINSSATPTFSGLTLSSSSATAGLLLTSTATAATGVGGTISFKGNYDTTPHSQIFGTITGAKSGNGDKSGVLAFQVSDSSGTLNTIMTLDGETSSVILGSPLSVNYGGTGLNSTGIGTSLNALVFTGTTNASSFQVLPNGTSGYVLQSNGSGSLPSWVTKTTGTVTSVAVGINLKTDQVVNTVANSPITSSGTIDLADTITGTVAWNASAIEPSYGGTGVSSFGSTNTNCVILTNATSASGAFSVLANGAAGQILTILSTGAPGWQNATGGTVTQVTAGTNISMKDASGTTVSSITSSGTISVSSITGTTTWAGTEIDVAHGGTGLTAVSAYGLLYGNTITTGPMLILAPGTSGQVLTSGGTAGAPSWTTPSAGTVYNITTGTNLTGGPITTTGTISLAGTLASSVIWNGSPIGMKYGGTGTDLSGSLTNGGIVYCTGTTMAVSAAGSVNSLLTSGGAAAPVWLAPGTSSFLITDSKSSLAWSSTLPGFSVSGNIVPNTNNTQSIGTSTDNFASGYFTTMNATTVNCTTLSVTNALAVTSGGTGATTLAANGILYMNSAQTAVLSLTTSNSASVLLWDGTNSKPMWSANSLSLSGNFSTAGGNSITLNTTASTNVTLPTSGLLSTVSATSPSNSVYTYTGSDQNLWIDTTNLPSVIVVSGTTTSSTSLTVIDKAGGAAKHPIYIAGPYDGDTTTFPTAVPLATLFTAWTWNIGGVATDGENIYLLVQGSTVQWKTINNANGAAPTLASSDFTNGTTEQVVRGSVYVPSTGNLSMCPTG